MREGVEPQYARVRPWFERDSRDTRPVNKVCCKGQDLGDFNTWIWLESRGPNPIQELWTLVGGLGSMGENGESPFLPTYPLNLNLNPSHWRVKWEGNPVKMESY
jgi:hypothetical protein